MIEEHLLMCLRCIDAAKEAAQYVDTIRAAIIAGDRKVGNKGMGME